MANKDVIDLFLSILGRTLRQQKKQGHLFTFPLDWGPHEDIPDAPPAEKHTEDSYWLRPIGLALIEGHMYMYSTAKLDMQIVTSY